MDSRPPDMPPGGCHWRCAGAIANVAASNPSTAGATAAAAATTTTTTTSSADDLGSAETECHAIHAKSPGSSTCQQSAEQSSYSRLPRSDGGSHLARRYVYISCGRTVGTVYHSHSLLFYYLLYVGISELVKEGQRIQSSGWPPICCNMIHSVLVRGLLPAACIAKQEKNTKRV